MKLFSQHPGAHVSMGDIPQLVEILRGVPHSHIVETGTHRGEGSTRMLTSLNPEKLVSIEVNFDNFAHAERLYEDNPAVEILHGLSLGRSHAEAFIRDDLSRLDMNVHKDVFIDDIVDPIGFYLNEIHETVPDGLLKPLLLEVKDKDPIVLLDSAGGLGWEEFNVTETTLYDVPHTIVLDDTHHLKHFRSRKYIFDNFRRYTILYDNPILGVMVARATPPMVIKVILGRYGDIAMVAKAMIMADLDHYIAVSKRYSKVLHDLGVGKERIIELDFQENTPIPALRYLEKAYPEATIINCQQNGTDPALMQDFRSYQSFQQRHASI